MAATPGHPLVADVIRRVAVNVRDPFFGAGASRWVCKKTGPACSRTRFSVFSGIAERI
jgi:hypothetical protein